MLLESPLRLVRHADGIHALRASLKDALRNVEALCEFLELDLREAPEALARMSRFSLLVTREFASRMEPGNWADPLLMQVLPLAREYADINAGVPTGLGRDVVGDLPATITPGLIHKYRGRALVISHGGCAIHCRYCFRRHFPYSSQTAGRAHWEKILQALSDNSDIAEVILSGGDPLMHSDEVIAGQIQDLAQIAHVRTVRVHTRIPILCPGRVGDALVAALSETRLRAVMVVHANHARELDADVGAALLRLGGAACVLNQSVLLAGINDDAGSLVGLSQALFNVGVLPYYLHLLDEIDGVGHFRVPLADARGLHRKMQEELPGYLVPRLVREMAGAPNKLWVNAEGIPD